MVPESTVMQQQQGLTQKQSLALVGRPCRLHHRPHHRLHHQLNHQQQQTRGHEGTALRNLPTSWLCLTLLAEGCSDGPELLHAAASAAPSRRVLQVCAGGQEGRVEGRRRGAGRAVLLPQCQQHLLHSQVNHTHTHWQKHTNTRTAKSIWVEFRLLCVYIFTYMYISTIIFMYIYNIYV